MLLLLSHTSRPSMPTSSRVDVPATVATARATSTTGIASRAVMANIAAASTRPPK
jgi:hypothetical protein